MTRKARVKQRDVLLTTNGTGHQQYVLTLSFIMVNKHLSQVSGWGMNDRETNVYRVHL